ncbi:DUF7740 domain-containing protein [Pseudomonas monteilii]
MADRVHGADAAMRSAVKHCAKKLPRRQHDIFFRMGNSPASRDWLVTFASSCRSD